MHALAKAHRAWVSADDFEELGARGFAQDVRKLAPLRAKEASAFLEALSFWASALEGRLEAMPTKVNASDDDVASSTVPWIPAGWRRFRTVVAVLQRLQDAHRPMSTRLKSAPWHVACCAKNGWICWASPTAGCKSWG